MAEAAQKFEELIVPEGGIAGFVGTEEEVEAMEAEDAKKEFGEAGIAEFSDVAKRMAGYGRFGDDTLAHVETGELIIPRALIEGNEKLREDIFNNLREQGVEDPERYVVGSEANSLNPDTGLPEFFFKKLFKGISKAFKGVVKVFKKIAPIVLPMVLGPLVGPIAAGALGSGIATLMNGGDLGDALKAGLTGGLMGAASSFGGGFLKGFQKGGFQGGISGGIGSLKASVGSMFGGTGAGAAAATPEADLKVAKPGTAASRPVISESMGDPKGATPLSMKEKELLDLTTRPDFNRPITPKDIMKIRDGAVSPAPSIKTVGKDIAPKIDLTSKVDVAPEASLAGTPSGTGGAGAVSDSQGFLGRTRDFLFGEAPTSPMEQAQARASFRQQGIQQGFSGENLDTFVAESMSASQPGFMRRTLPTAALGLGALAAAGGFKTPEYETEVDPMFQQTGQDLFQANPSAYLVSPSGGAMPTFAQVATPTTFGFYQPPPSSDSPFDRPSVVTGMEHGGEVFPRRNGGIMPYEGVPDEDSVRAMLMPGEFVMTTDAVRGAGGGDLNKGINNMYSVMRNLESRGRAAQ